ncbi:MAG: TatD family hydrolase [Cytophagaceae bacterium]|nr:TatD family hydrolase [Cytophagaceae bacterium]
MKIIDTHAHIYNDQFDGDRHDMIMRAFEGGVEKIFMPNVDHASIDGMLELEEKYPGKCIAMMGLHPCDVKKDFEKELYLVEDWLKKRKFSAVGEMGIDLYWDLTFKEQQVEAFKIQAELAKKYRLPIVIHSRNATRETIDLVRKLKDENLTGVFHCFSGTPEEAKEITELGFFLGIGGVVTFKNGGLDKVLPEVDIDYLVLETDSPYLAPVPYRGKRNEPGHLDLIAAKLAEIKQMDREEVAVKTSTNALKLFKM